MKSHSLAPCCLLLLFVVACESRGEAKHPESAELSLVGQVVLPEGVGSRGIELRVAVAEAGRDARVTWVLFDDHGRFAHALQGSLKSVTLTAGLGATVHRIEAEALPDVDPSGQIDLGVIDLRDRLARHRLVLRAAEGTPSGVVRVALCFGLPPVGPYGEPVSLGSRQFPPIDLGSEMEWLLPHDSGSIHFLVERPAGPERGRSWRSGEQRLFGPFDSAELPAELVVD